MNIATLSTLVTSISNIFNIQIKAEIEEFIKVIFTLFQGMLNLDTYQITYTGI